ncbi:MAG: hypothetical protein GF311_21780 [Candidatus Lokiarchaeota archaeon]|nr:hypothetical protein [Candidatus Lokiarchaeota archaeon]
MVKTNIFLSKSKIPNNIQTYRIRTSLLNVEFNELENHMFNNGWFCFRQKDYVIFLRISATNYENVPIPAEWIDDNIEPFSWEVIDIDDINKFKICFNAAFRNVVRKMNSNLHVSRRKPIIKENYSNELFGEIESAEGFFYQPCLIEKRLGMIFHYRIFFPRGTLMNQELLTKTQLKPNNYFSKLNQFINKYLKKQFLFFIGEHKFAFNLTHTLVRDDIDLFEVSLSDEDEILTESSESGSEISNDNTLEEEVDDVIEIDLSSLKIYSNFENPINILPNNIVVGRDQTSNWRKNEPLTPIWQYLRDFGPYQNLDLKKLWMIPIYDDSNLDFRDNISNICEDLKNRGRHYRNPGFQDWLRNIEVITTDPIPININSDIDTWLTQVIQDQKNRDSDFPEKYRKNFPFQAILIIQMPYTNQYYEIKKVLSNRGIPCQIITQVDINNRNYAYYRWNLLTSIYAKLGGTIWTIKAKNPGRLNDINLILGFRFKRVPGGDFITAIATVITGSGEFIGYYAEKFDISQFRTTGMKLTEDQINKILSNLHIQFLSNIHDPSILITRLGPMPSEERELFIDYFNKLNISNYAICTFSRDLLRLSTISEDFLPLGTFIAHDRNKGTIIPIGNLRYKTGRKIISLSRRLSSIPTCYYLELEVNEGIYINDEDHNPIESLAHDIINLCWLNWQNVFFPIAGMPVTLNYAEKIANYLSHGVIARGELHDTLWFI